MYKECCIPFLLTPYISERIPNTLYRLEHTINNLDNVVENTTSPESQIRDTNMAGEMVRYSNNSILQQAGQSCPLRQISPIRAYCAYLVNCFTYLSEFIAHCIDCHNETDRSFQGGRSVRLYPIYSFYAESFFLPPFRHIYTPMCASAHIPINI